jgi:hypothetical protein
MAFLRALVALAGMLGASAATAATITQQYDLTLVGDDPDVALFLLPNPFLPGFPLEATFEGYAENLNPFPYNSNGIEVGFRDPGPPRADYTMTADLPDADPVTGPVQLPVFFSHSFASAPSQLFVEFRTDGPDENTHFNGTVTLTGTVPEPSTLAMLFAALPLAYVAYRRR